jgi:hypothetical protein
MDQAASWAKTPIETDRTNGLLYGFPDGGFHPLENTTRAQIAAIFHRLVIELHIVEIPEPPGPGPVVPEYFDYIGYSAQLAVNTTNGIIEAFNTCAPIGNDEANVSFSVDTMTYNKQETDGVRVQTMNVNGEINGDIGEQLVTLATMLTLNLVEEGREGFDADYEEIKEIVRTLVDEINSYSIVTGVTLTRDNVEELAKAIFAGLNKVRGTSIYHDARGQAIEYKNSYRDCMLSNNTYVAGGATVKVGDAEIEISVQNNKASLVGTDRFNAVKDFAVALLKEFHKEIAACAENEYKTELTGAVRIDVEFTGNTDDTDAAKEIKKNTDHFTYKYALEINFDLNGNDNVEYKRQRGKDYLLFHLTEEAQAAYGESALEIADDLVDEQVARDVFRKIREIRGSVEDIELFERLINILTDYTANDREGSIDLVVGHLYQWFADNDMVVDETEPDPEGRLKSNDVYKLLVLHETEVETEDRLDNDELIDLIIDVCASMEGFVDDHITKPTLELVIEENRYNFMRNIIIDNIGEERFSTLPEFLQDYVIRYFVAHVMQETLPTGAEDRTALNAGIYEIIQMGEVIKALLPRDFQDVYDLSDIHNVSIDAVINMMEKEVFLEKILELNGSKRLSSIATRIIEKIPAGAAITIDGYTVNRATLEDLTNALKAKDIVAVAIALGTIADESGLRDRKLSELGEGNELLISIDAGSLGSFSGFVGLEID